jgi:hypothetical protein
VLVEGVSNDRYRISSCQKGTKQGAEMGRLCACA